MRWPAALPLLLAVPATAQEEMDSTRFESVTLMRGLERPMELTVAPDGRVFWIELEGKLRIWKPESGEVVEAGKLEVFAEQENGLIGLALDPAFERNQHVYLMYSPLEYPGQHLSRFTIKGDQLDLASEQLILRFEEQRRECCHHAGALEFGPDGLLFIATGDNTHPGGDSQGFAPIDERPNREPFDAQKGPANTQSLSGKILRIRLTEAGYEIPDGNLFSDPEHGRPEIYVMGCRNPWRIGVDQKTGFLYWGEVGPDAGGKGARGPRGYDEINQARAAGNFGWPYFIADNQAYHDVDFATGEVGAAYDPQRPENLSPNNTGARFLPAAQPAWIYYPYGDSDKFPELNAAGGRTACAGPVYDFDPELESDSKFPAHFDRCLFVFEWSRHWITAVHLDENSNIERLERFLPDRKFKRPVDLEFGPDGSLYLLEYGTTWGVNEDSALVRIDYYAGNRAPRAAIEITNNIGPAPLALEITTDGTFDPDDDALEYAWRVPPMERVLSTEAVPDLTFAYEGSYNLELTVTDPDGLTATAVVPVLVGNTPPELRFIAPRDGDFYLPGEPIAWSLHAEDVEDGVLSDPVQAAAQVSTEVAWHRGAPPGSADASAQPAHPGKESMQRSDCFHCHAVQNRVVGPSFLEIAGKYRGEHDALTLLAQRVREGSTGVWGQVPMLPHPQHSQAEAQQMVSWILALTDQGPAISVQRGLSGTVAAEGEPSSLVLSARYSDRGQGVIGPLTARAQVRLRHPAVEAEHFSHHAGNSTLHSDTATGGAFIGAITAGSHLRFDRIDLAGMERVSLRVSSAGEGGFIELRAGSVDGPILGSTEVVPNGAWEDWYEIEIPIADPGGALPLIVRFHNPKGGGGLMNLDRICFLREGQSVTDLVPEPEAPADGD